MYYFRIFRYIDLWATRVIVPSWVLLQVIDGQCFLRNQKGEYL